MKTPEHHVNLFYHHLQSHRLVPVLYLSHHPIHLLLIPLLTQSPFLVQSRLRTARVEAPVAAQSRSFDPV